MPKRSSKRPKDINELADEIVREATGEAPDDPSPGQAETVKDPAAVALGRRGGVKGGRARADKMTPEQRSEAARHAARTRWQRES